MQHVQHSHGVKIYVESSNNNNNNNNHHHHHHHLHQLQQLQQNQTKSSTSSSSSASSVNNLSGSSTCSSNNSSSNNNNNNNNNSGQNSSQSSLQQQLQRDREQQQNLPPPGLRHHPLLPPPDLHGNPFGLLRMPMPPLSQNQLVPHGPLFSRPHHDFRMEQLVSEQFRHHGLNLAAAAVAAANQLQNSHNQAAAAAAFGANVPNVERPPSSGKLNIPSMAPSTQQSLGMEPHLDFYSQRLRQLAGTTSPGGVCVSSPSPRKQHSPSHFASPSPSQQLPPTPLTNNSRPQSLTPTDKHSSEMTNESNGGAITVTPRSSSTPPKQSLSADAIHSCEYCGKKFRFQSNLIVHKRTHTGEDQYKCTNCDFACLQASKLRRHMRLHRTPEDRASNSGSVETENEDSPDDMDEEEAEAEEMDEEMDDEDNDEEAEDLSIANVQNLNNNNNNNRNKDLMDPRHTNAAASLVGELMDKFGLSNIAQYSEAYKQALQESGNALKLHLTSKDRDNNNTALSIPGLAEKLNGFPSALRLKEEFAKNMMQHHQNTQLPQVPLFNPFENPFDASKRLKMENNDSWWNLSNFHHRNESLLENLKSKMPQGLNSQSNMQSAPKKESRRNDTCEYCGKVFKNCSNLTVHRRSHTGEKPYKCELCSYACAQSSKLTRHMKTHGRLGKDVYRCRFCEMPFSVPSTLEKHMRKCVVNQGKAPSAIQQQQHNILMPPQQMPLGLQLGVGQNSLPTNLSTSGLNMNCNSNGSSMSNMSMGGANGLNRSMDENSNQSQNMKDDSNA